MNEREPSILPIFQVGGIILKPRSKEASEMKRLLYSMTAATVAAVVALASSSPVAASDNPTSDPAQNTAGNGQNVPAQNASPQEAKGTTTSKVNVDSQGIILKGCDVVAYFKQGKAVKGNSAIESTYQGATYLFASAAPAALFRLFAFGAAILRALQNNIHTNKRTIALLTSERDALSTRVAALQVELQERQSLNFSLRSASIPSLLAGEHNSIGPITPEKIRVAFLGGKPL
jgi:hypothetical protein